ncbi:hypothetical protein [Myroides sp. WP-1]|uniref:hypothetical protein n=1 Tax=Myroides sp. WP-1 TaxID=2759944 RepID=UPI0015FC40C2|nr:hypothetical protein [Myroides sp. WP-1]MBB1137893.1 hypothetical protein [Myroides sp. WP-1]
MQAIIQEFETLIEQFPLAILALSPTEMESKTTPDKWSKKEIVGHLIDSAVTNYLRFIKAQFQENPQLFYEQVEYCQSANYQETELIQLVELWSALNKQLLFLFQIILQKNVQNRVCNNQTLAYLMEDYVKHFKHHQKQIFE